MKFLSSIVLFSLLVGCATNKEIRSAHRVDVPGTAQRVMPRKFAHGKS
jgi:hypothetical protein